MVRDASVKNKFYLGSSNHFIIKFSLHLQKFDLVTWGAAQWSKSDFMVEFHRPSTAFCLILLNGSVTTLEGEALVTVFSL